MGGVSSLVCDAHGSVVASVPNTVWTAGSVKRVFSDPFGAVREGSDATGSGGHQFLGAVRDTSSGLTLLGARYYDESVGRFISVDPVLDPGLPAQFNAYVYSGNNPATWSDPSGTLWQGGQWRSDAPAASSSSGVKKKTGTTVPASTSPAALQQCPDVSCRASWLVGFQVQMFGGIAEGIGALLWMTCVLCTTVQSTVENFDMFTDWDGFTARKMAEAQAQQALFAAGPGAVWDAITKPIVDDWANNPGHALGGTLVTVGTFAIPGGGVLKGVRGVKAAEEAVTVAANAGGDFSRIIMTSPRQLQSKFKHASDFGVAGNYSKANAAEFSAALNQHINSAGTRAIQGTYRGQSVTHYLDSSTRLNVILRNGEFVSGWKLSPDQLANVLRNGSLGGG
nr:colicin D domain-containing protein [Terrimesophilobacter mesophilus]